jgi:mRNA-degrading endonuclease RelE of RelBE toxin-antitoxin system
MNVIVSNAAKIAVTGLPDEDQRRVHAWFDHLKNWPADQDVQRNSTRLLPDEEPNVYVLRTTSDVRIFFTVDANEVTVVDVARKEALRTVKLGSQPGQ